MPNNKVDKPSDADFVKAMTDNLPNSGEIAMDFLKGFAITSAINYDSKRRK